MKRSKKFLIAGYFSLVFGVISHMLRGYPNADYFVLALACMFWSNLLGALEDLKDEAIK